MKNICGAIPTLRGKIAAPMELKSGKDYSVHSARNTFVKNDDYHVKKAFVLSNTSEITKNGKINYLPIYGVMFFGADALLSIRFRLSPSF